MTEEMAPARSSDVSMEGLTGACVSPPEVSGAEAEPTSSDVKENTAVCCYWTQWCRCLKNHLPLDFWNEAFQLFKLAGPVVRLETIAAPSSWYLTHFVSTQKYSV